ncbi:hypothetical protein [Erythrobacter sp. R86502]|uniref:hypothetical protein n=1 Tax=Erythrobacter sp. R86502 TaxID=3093846 RepID=UPI0036D23703
MTRRTLMHLGRTPAIRRVVAAVLLAGCAAGLTWVRADPAQLWIELGINLLAAVIAFVFLHMRWRTRERRELTPKQAKDIFS